jgi:hypothetical protein
MDRLVMKLDRAKADLYAAHALYSSAHHQAALVQVMQ